MASGNLLAPAAHYSPVFVLIAVLYPPQQRFVPGIRLRAMQKAVSVERAHMKSSEGVKRYGVVVMGR